MTEQQRRISEGMKSWWARRRGVEITAGISREEIVSALASQTRAFAIDRGRRLGADGGMIQEAIEKLSEGR